MRKRNYRNLSNLGLMLGAAIGAIGPLSRRQDQTPEDNESADSRMKDDDLTKARTLYDDITKRRTLHGDDITKRRTLDSVLMPFAAKQEAKARQSADYQNALQTLTNPKTNAGCPIYQQNIPDEVNKQRVIDTNRIELRWEIANIGRTLDIMSRDGTLVPGGEIGKEYHAIQAKVLAYKLALKDAEQKGVR